MHSLCIIVLSNRFSNLGVNQYLHLFNTTAADMNNYGKLLLSYIVVHCDVLQVVSYNVPQMCYDPKYVVSFHHLII